MKKSSFFIIFERSQDRDSIMMIDEFQISLKKKARTQNQRYHNNAFKYNRGFHNFEKHLPVDIIIRLYSWNDHKRIVFSVNVWTIKFQQSSAWSTISDQYVFWGITKSPPENHIWLYDELTNEQVSAIESFFKKTEIFREVDILNFNYSASWYHKYKKRDCLIQITVMNATCYKGSSSSNLYLCTGPFSSPPHSLPCAGVVHVTTSAVTPIEALVRPTDSQCWGDVQGLHPPLPWWQGPKNYEKHPHCERASGTPGHHQKEERCLPSLLMFRLILSPRQVWSPRWDAKSQP